MVHKKVVNAVLLRFLEEINTCRMKDLERFTFVLSMFNWPAAVPGRPDSNIYEMLAAEASKPEREKEINQHPRCLANFLQYLATMGTFPLPLIDKCLSLNFIGNVYTSAMQKVGGEILSLDVAIQIEHPDYTGSRLEERTRRYLSKSVSMHPSRWQDLNMSKGPAGDIQLKNMIAVAQELVQDPAKLLSEDNHMELLPIPEYIRLAELGQIRKPLDSGKFICLVAASWNLLIRGTYLGMNGIKHQTNFIIFKAKLMNVLQWNLF
ncbi:hypothetical protein B566_EDAN007995 [Ephemera danica]|nr:hypothetical protein B566_EDAN007995 [Ephemera danica]